ncbi:unnamed protein product [Rhizophagus irregularis]|uniref:Arrestin C-terminal-like domain-containing protein n=1 Tax=Rhizophagus irregularis TaxID=588596 RepID=A0A2I1GKS1_9GLOM|nr:hypothetical protein RhiirA4_543819 [Rhizophagus irregularis]CAB4417398.1 unnamed protein product [Rhizophagus irregularis]CAB4418112.1 unnamed protein product [Rhizophagus irregularis]
MEDYTYLLSKQTSEDDYYDYNNNKLYFTYKQQGCLGIQQSRINGTFHVRYPTNSPLKVEKIDIIFSGIGMVQWNEGDKINYAETKYFEYSSCVYNEEENHLLSYSDLPFEFMIPENIPSSILSIPSKLTNHLGKARIYYSIKAIITKPKNLLKKSKKIVEIECPITKYVQQKEIENQNSVILTKKLDNYEYSILFDKTKFDQNYNNIINLPLSIEKGILKNIKKIQISLKENYLLKVGNKTHLIKNVLFKKVINKEKISRIENNNNNIKYLINCKLCLYGKRIRNSVETDLINIWHQVNIDISLKGRRKIRIFEKVIDIVSAINNDINVIESDVEECEYETW